jgi:hypothetical protein
MKRHVVLMPLAFYRARFQVTNLVSEPDATAVGGNVVKNPKRSYG